MVRKPTEYVFNPETLDYKVYRESDTVKAIKTVGYVAAVVFFVLLYIILYFQVFKLDMPKTAVLKHRNAKWQNELNIVNRNVDECQLRLEAVEGRDDKVYRPLYGLSEIPDEVKQAGFGGVNRYAYLDEMGAGQQLKETVHRIEVLTKRSYIRSKTLDEAFVTVRKSGDLLAHIPAIPPIAPVKGSYRISSSFGYRSDPMSRKTKHHEGIDMATSLGNPVYVTADGVVERVKYQFFGYGNEVIVDHGFGYKTRYAHLNSIDVWVGQKLTRGQKIAETGNTGKSTGPHLHYEVIYLKKAQDPSKYMDLSMDVEEYRMMTSQRHSEMVRAEEESEERDNG